MATNPRIEDLRKRIERDPGSRLFAQLAEELRKDGELEDAIRVARDGLQKHPSYPSARMTLGRALLDTGDWAAARTEFELVLKSAADNILASRYLAECLENLGDRAAAIARYKATLALAPGEKHVLARLQELEKGATPGFPVLRQAVGLRPGSSVAPPPAAAAPPPRPIPLSTVEGEMELETSRPGPGAAGPASAPPLAPIPLVAADEEFELEQPYESPTTGIGLGQVSGASAPPPSAAPALDTAEDKEFELEAPHEAPSTGWAASIRPLPVVEEAPPVAPPPAVAPSRPPAPPTPPTPIEAPTPMAASTPFVPAIAPAAAHPEPAPPASRQPEPAPASSALISPTLGELYFNQGFTDKAIEVYRELNAREPGNERLTTRLHELEKLQGTQAAGEPAVDARGRTGGLPPAADGAAADRREAIERTIARLEGLLSAIRKG